MVFRERRSGNVPSQAEFERKQAKRTTVKDLRSILRLTYEQGLSVRAISERLQLSKTSVATYLLRAREAGLSWPLPPIYESEAALQRVLFRRVGRPPEDLSEPEWPRVAQELKRKGVTLTLLWQEYRTAHPDGYGYTWFCEKFDAYRRRANPTFRHRHAAGAAIQTDYAGPTVEVIDPQTGEIRQAQIFVAVLAASSLTFAMASYGQRLPDWIEGQTRALSYFGGVPKAIVCDNLKAGVVKACGSSRHSTKPLPPWPSITTRRFCRPAAASRVTRAQTHTAPRQLREDEVTGSIW